jgi:phosphoribosyl-ATP pyrophosphohydrolase / phosphoribosyl-AMP cyclohydrolase / histidinol dehydrogenase
VCLYVLGLWRKGDTSGMHQELLAVSYDCDRDALRFSVIQHGDPKAFCHLLTRTCWGSETGLQRLESTLRERKRDAPVGSYTKKLFDDPDLLRKKMLEEVQELVEAEEPDHIAAEAADVLYFVMTRCVAAGVGLKEIEKHLDMRAAKVTRRPGLAKEWRTIDAEKVLSAPK